MTTIKPSYALMTGIFVSALVLTLCSILFSTTFGVLLGSNGILKFAFAVAFGAITTTEIALGAVLSIGIRMKHGIVIGLSSMLLIGCFVFNVLAGQTVIQTSVDKITTERAQSSDEYLVAVQRRETAKAKMDGLFIAPETVSQAERELADISSKIAQYRSQPAKNSIGQNAGTVGARVGDCSSPESSYYKRQYCGELVSLYSRRDSLSSVKDSQSRYISAQSHYDSILTEGLPTAVESSALPGLTALSNVTGINVNQLGDSLFLWLAVFIEVCAISLWVLLGFLKQIDNPQTVSTRQDPSIDGEFVYLGYRQSQGKPLVMTRQSQDDDKTVTRQNRDKPYAVTRQTIDKPTRQTDGTAPDSLTNAILSRVVNPSSYAINKWCRVNGISVTKRQVSDLQSSLLSQGYIHTKQLSNGKMTYERTDK